MRIRSDGGAVATCDVFDLLLDIPFDSAIAVWRSQKKAGGVVDLDELGALALKNGILASPAVARASRVFPVPGSGKQHTFRRAGSEFAVLLWITQEIDDLGDFGLDFIDSRDIFEGRPHGIRIPGFFDPPPKRPPPIAAFCRLNIQT